MCLACRKQLKMSIYYHCNCHFHNFAQNRLSLAFLESRAFLRMDGWGGNHDTVSGVFRNTDSVHRWRKGTLEKLGNSDEVTLLARGRAEFTLQVLHILVLISFLLSFHFTLYITVVEVFIRSLQNTIIGSSGNFSAFYLLLLCKLWIFSIDALCNVKEVLFLVCWAFLSWKSVFF